MLEKFSSALYCEDFELRFFDVDFKDGSFISYQRNERIQRCHWNGYVNAIFSTRIKIAFRSTIRHETNPKIHIWIVFDVSSGDGVRNGVIQNVDPIAYLP